MDEFDEWDNIGNPMNNHEFHVDKLRLVHPPLPPFGPPRDAIARTRLGSYIYPPTHLRDTDWGYQRAMRNVTYPEFYLQRHTKPEAVVTQHFPVLVVAPTPYGWQQRRCTELAHHVPVFHDDLGAGVLWLRSK